MNGTESLGGGLRELRHLGKGPGYRVYMTIMRDRLMILGSGDERRQAKDVEVRDGDYSACSTERVDMCKCITAQVVGNPSYMAAIPLTVPTFGPKAMTNWNAWHSRHSARSTLKLTRRCASAAVRPIGGATRTPSSASSRRPPSAQPCVHDPAAHPLLRPDATASQATSPWL